MDNEKSKRADKFFEGRGFYIVLALCIAVIGISAISLVRMKGADTEPDISLANTPTPVESIAPVMNTEEPKIVDIEEPEGATVNTYKSSNTYEEKPTWVWPIEGELGREYTVEALAYDVTMRDWRTHDGIDVLADKGELVRAASSGKVESIENDDLYGTTVVIDHGKGIKTVYSNLADVPTVKVGDEVKAGEIIGSVGATALCETGQENHLHFAMTKDSKSVNPLDYLPE